MQRVVAKAVQLVQFAFIHTFFPVDVKDAFGDSCHLIYFICIEGDDTHTHEIGHIVDALVFCAFQLQFSHQRLLSLHTMFHGGNVDAFIKERMTQLVIGILCQLFQCGTQFPVLLHQRHSMRVQFHFFFHLFFMI